jgi:predicted TIM-barrel fold metal-dependent hydrolase
MAGVDATSARVHAGRAHRHGCDCGTRRGFLTALGALGATALLPAGRAGAQSAAPAPAGSPRRIDVHHHFFPPAYLEPLQYWGKQAGFGGLYTQQRDWTIASAVEDMDRNGVATAMLSISTPGVWFGDAAAARRMARLCNEYAATMARDHPGRFGLFAATSMPDVDGTLREIAYALDVLKADGIGLMTSYGDKWPGDPAFAPVFEELDRRKAIVYFHPLAPGCCGGMLIPSVTASPIEYPHDTTRAMVSLLAGGTFARRTNIRFIFSHAGGTMPMLAGRIVNALGGRKDLAEIAPRGIDHELRRHHFDTANSFYAPTMTALLSFVSASQVLFGTDFPYLTIGRNVAGMASLGLAPETMAAIEHANADKLLHRNG